MSERPQQSFDFGLQHERTALAWERTAMSMMAAGVLLARYAATDSRAWLALIGLFQVTIGAGLLLWASWHYEELHGPLREGTSVVHPTAARLIGISTVAFVSASLVLATLITFG